MNEHESVESDDSDEHGEDDISEEEYDRELENRMNVNPRLDSNPSEPYEADPSSSARDKRYIDHKHIPTNENDLNYVAKLYRTKFGNMPW